jgi:SAM-dependent methyltransferase
MVKEQPEKDMARRVEAMYNAHPFPHRDSIPKTKSDERYKYIYKNFLHIPLTELNGKLFLDAGCGTGDVTWAFRRILDPSVRVMGLDLSRTAIAIARQIDDTNQCPMFGINSLLNVGLADKSVDFLLCGGVLVAVVDPDQVFRELIRVLKPGGYIVIILYHKYGRAIHSLRRTIIDLLEPEDIDRRAELGGKLVGAGMKRLGQKEHVPLKGLLYDQFGLPCESCYSVKQALIWFKQENINYLGSWPPVEWLQFGKAFRFSNDFARLRRSPLGSLLLRLFPERDDAPCGPPNLLNRFSMELLWTLTQQQLFAVSGRKA